MGRPALPPERRLKASLLMARHTVRSARRFCEQRDYNCLFRGFLDLEADAARFAHWTFARHRARLLEHAVAAEFFGAVVAQARGLNLLADEHFTVDGTLVEAWAARKSFKRKEAGPGEPPADRGNPPVNCHGARRRNATHQSTTDPAAQLAKQGAGKDAQLCSSATALRENRHARWVDCQLAPAAGDAERRAARARVDGHLPGRHRITLAGDKGYATRDFVAHGRALAVTPHVARTQARPGGAALDGRTTRPPGDALSQWLRTQVEEAFGWMKTIGGLRKTRYRGRARLQLHAFLVATAYHLVRSARLAPAAT